MCSRMGKGIGITSARRLLNYAKQGGKKLSPKQRRRNQKKNRRNT